MLRSEEFGKFVIALAVTLIMPWVSLVGVARDEPITLPTRLIIGGLWLAFEVGFSWWRRTSLYALGGFLGSVFYCLSLAVHAHYSPP